MAPSTPPPPSKLPFAALTRASTGSVVMSAMQMSSRVVPISAERMGMVMAYPSRHAPAEDREGRASPRQFADAERLLSRPCRSSGGAGDPQAFGSVDQK